MNCNYFILQNNSQIQYNNILGCLHFFAFKRESTELYFGRKPHGDLKASLLSTTNA